MATRTRACLSQPNSNLFGEAVFDSCFKFAFVRNPWDRMVSYYHYVTSKDNHHRKSRVERLGGFHEYLQYEARRKKVGQSVLLTDPKSGELLVDFVGRFENLAEDFDNSATALVFRRDATSKRFKASRLSNVLQR